MITFAESIQEFGAAMLLGVAGLVILRIRQTIRKRATA
jgi:hypothetical protein